MQKESCRGCKINPLCILRRILPWELSSSGTRGSISKFRPEKTSEGCGTVELISIYATIGGKFGCFWHDERKNKNGGEVRHNAVPLQDNSIHSGNIQKDLNHTAFSLFIMLISYIQ